MESLVKLEFTTNSQLVLLTITVSGHDQNVEHVVAWGGGQ